MLIALKEFCNASTIFKSFFGISTEDSAYSVAAFPETFTLLQESEITPKDKIAAPQTPITHLVHIFIRITSRNKFGIEKYQAVEKHFKNHEYQPPFYNKIKYREKSYSKDSG